MIGNKALIINSERHSEYNFQICKVVDMNTKGNLFQVELGEKEPKTYLWIEKKELMPILYSRKEDIEKYGKLEDIYNLFAEYKAYYDFICKLADEECNRAEKLTKENKELQYEVAENQKHLHNLNAKIKELRTRCHESARDNFDNELYGLLHVVGREELREDKPVIPNEPIKVAEMLIDNYSVESVSYTHYAIDNGISYSEDTFNKLHGKEVKLLRQIAEHLLVYCNAKESVIEQ